MPSETAFIGLPSELLNVEFEDETGTACRLRREELLTYVNVVSGAGNAVEELLRSVSPAPHVARYVTRDVEVHGRTVPEGSAMMMLIGAANRDHRQFPPDGDVFDIHRDTRVGGGPGQRRALAHLHRARLGNAARVHLGKRIRRR